MKKLKPNQIGPWCSFCPPKTTRALYRQDGYMPLYCCQTHIEQLKQEEKKQRELDNHLTEADYQTWMRV